MPPLYFAGTSFINLQLITWVLRQTRYPEELIINKKPYFNCLPHTWIQNPIKTRLHNAKRLMNCPSSQWIGYFFVAQPKHVWSCCTERFNPFSPYYQAWFGIYVNVGGSDAECSPGYSPDGQAYIQELAKIGIGDQRSWLGSYRAVNPKVEVLLAKELPDPTSFHPQAQVAFLGEMITQSDLNEQASNDWRYNQMFGIPDKKWLQYVPAHHELLLRGYFVSWNWPEIKTSVIIYCSIVADMLTSTGEHISYWSQLEHELRQMIYNVKFNPI